MVEIDCVKKQALAETIGSSVFDSTRSHRVSVGWSTRPRSTDGFGTSGLTFVGEDDLLAIRVSHWKSMFNLCRLRFAASTSPTVGKGDDWSERWCHSPGKRRGDRKTGRVGG